MNKRTQLQRKTRCSHVWIVGYVDFGLSYTTELKSIEQIRAVRNYETCLKYHFKIEHCSICFLERYIDPDNKQAYLRYWQKELKNNRELVTLFYNQLRESPTPMNYEEFVKFRIERTNLTGEHFEYITRLP